MQQYSCTQDELHPSTRDEPQALLDVIVPGFIPIVELVLTSFQLIDSGTKIVSTIRDNT